MNRSAYWDDDLSGRWFVGTTNSNWWNSLSPTYNPETHELVEKKEAKIKRLKDELQRWKDDVEILDEEILFRSKEKSEAKILINKIEEELKSLE